MRTQTATSVKMAAFRRSLPEQDYSSLDEGDGSSNCSSPFEYGGLVEREEIDGEGEEDSEAFRKEEPAGKSESNCGKQGRKGRKATWKECYLNDMVDVIVSKEYYKKNIIFTNTKNCRNSELYRKVLEELQRRYDSAFPFNVDQIRNKFKKLISDCKKLALTVKTATGIKRIQEDKGYGAWFDQLFPLVRSRDSCNPEMSVEPSTSSGSAGEKEKNRKRSNGTPGNSESGEETTSSEPDKLLFVPTKKAAGKRKSKDETLQSVVGIMKTVIEKDPAKDLIKFFQEENDKAREHEMRMMQLFMTSSRPPLPMQNQQSSHAYGSFTHPYTATTSVEVNPSYGSPSCSGVSYQGSPHEGGFPYYSEEPRYQQL